MANKRSCHDRIGQNLVPRLQIQKLKHPNVWKSSNERTGLSLRATHYEKRDQPKILVSFLRITTRLLTLPHSGSLLSRHILPFSHITALSLQSYKIRSTQKQIYASTKIVLTCTLRPVWLPICLFVCLFFLMPKDSQKLTALASIKYSIATHVFYILIVNAFFFSAPVLRGTAS